MPGRKIRKPFVAEVQLPFPPWHGLFTSPVLAFFPRWEARLPRPARRLALHPQPAADRFTLRLLRPPAVLRLPRRTRRREAGAAVTLHARDGITAAGFFVVARCTNSISCNTRPMGRGDRIR